MSTPTDAAAMAAAEYARAKDRHWQVVEVEGRARRALERHLRREAGRWARLPAGPGSIVMGNPPRTPMTDTYVWIVQAGVSDAVEGALAGACRRWFRWFRRGPYSDGRLGPLGSLRRDPPNGYIVVGPRPPDLPKGLPEIHLSPEGGSLLRAAYALLHTRPNPYQLALMEQGE